MYSYRYAKKNRNLSWTFNDSFPRISDLDPCMKTDKLLSLRPSRKLGIKFYSSIVTDSFQAENLEVALPRFHIYRFSLAIMTGPG